MSEHPVPLSRSGSHALVHLSDPRPTDQAHAQLEPYRQVTADGRHEVPRHHAGHGQPVSPEDPRPPHAGYAHPASGPQGPAHPHPAPSVHSQQQFACAHPYPQQTQIIVVQQPRSVGVSLILTFFFGPLGMLYTTVGGFVAMFLITLVAVPFTLGLAVLVTWPICMIWGAVAASGHNARVVLQHPGPMPLAR